MTDLGSPGSLAQILWSATACALFGGCVGAALPDPTEADRAPVTVPVSSTADDSEPVAEFDMRTLVDHSQPVEPSPPALTKHALEVRGYCLTWCSDNETVLVGGSNRISGGIFQLSLSSPYRRTRISSDGRNAAASPSDPTTAVFTRGSGASETVWQIRTDGNSRRRSRVAKGGWPQWSADGKTLFLRIASPSQQLLAFAVATDTTPVAPVTGSRTARSPATGSRSGVSFAEATKIDPRCRLSCFFPTISPDGKLLARHYQRWFVVTDLKDGSEQVSFPWEARGCLIGWSRDSRFVAYGSYAFGQQSGIMLADLKRKRARVLLAGDYTRPSFAPDGRRLAADLREPGRTPRIHIFDLPADLTALWDDP